jgi:hypothetical protein
LLRVHPQDHNIFEIADERLGQAEPAAFAVGGPDLFAADAPTQDVRPGRERGRAHSRIGREREGESRAQLSRKRRAVGVCGIAAGMLLLAVVAIANRATEQTTGRAEAPDRTSERGQRDHGPAAIPGIASQKRQHLREPQGSRSAGSRSGSPLPRRSRPAHLRAARSRIAVTKSPLTASSPPSAHAASVPAHEFGFEK